MVAFNAFTGHPFFPAEGKLLRVLKTLRFLDQKKWDSLRSNRVSNENTDIYAYYDLNLQKDYAKYYTDFVWYIQSDF